mmetsp:Transcript_24040/g.32947  ORF Transcript_24040/g.32947 Transcript_24040/m.32947 type:complete len:274 (-) Transcript_24040:123-944(-)
MASVGKKVIVVTGSNKGIGLAIVKGLCAAAEEGWKIYLTSRDEKRGQEAIASLGSQRVTPVFHQLDIQDEKSVNKLAEDLKEEGIDILINNAGFAYKNAATEPFSEQAEVTNDINYFGTLRVSLALLPLLKKGGKVVNIGSQAGLLKLIKSEELKNKLESDKLTIDELSDIVRSFVKAAAEGNHQEKGFPNTAYGFSKIGVHAMTRILSRGDLPEGASLSACCPGWCKTDMAGHEKPPRTAEQGADTPIFLALKGESSKINGRFFYEREEREW